jgi:deoxyadenosine/deoxycytidine kinase
MVIALEGLPGSGKTTSARLLGKSLDRQVVCETTHDHPFLASVYDDAARHDLQVELAFLLLHSSAYRDINDRSVITDFSPVKDLLFAEEMLFPSDLALFQEIYARLYAELDRPNVVAYLDAAPELCMERIEHRMTRDERRAFEEGLELERLQRMWRRYMARLDDLGERVVRVPISPELSEGDVLDLLLGLLEEQVAE